ncbi:MAG: threonylcarbamoyl-AMP synthase [Caldisericia bacterium]|nr:threonylcarbamoyl-AMP synthase [Caldisericia bacterium]
MSRLNEAEKNYCKEFLLLGYPIVFYTDTVMGIGANGLSKSAVDNIYFLKKRTFDKPLILFLANSKDAIEYVDDPTLLEHSIVKDNWPGSLTAVFKKKKESSLYYSKDLNCDTLGIRIPDSDYLRDLINYLPFPLVTTSANISKNAPFADTEQAQREFCKNILIINMKTSISKKGVSPSSVVSFVDNEIKVLRDGEALSSIKN